MKPSVYFRGFYGHIVRTCWSKKIWLWVKSQMIAIIVPITEITIAVSYHDAMMRFATALVVYYERPIYRT